MTVVVRKSVKDNNRTARSPEHEVFSVFFGRIDIVAQKAFGLRFVQAGNILESPRSPEVFPFQLSLPMACLQGVVCPLFGRWIILVPNRRAAS